MNNKETPKRRCCFTLRENDGVLLGNDNGERIAMLLDRVDGEQRRARFLVWGIPDIREFDVLYDYEKKHLNGIDVEVGKVGSSGKRICVSYFIPESYFAKRMKPDEVCKYFFRQSAASLWDEKY